MEFYYNLKTANTGVKLTDISCILVLSKGLTSQGKAISRCGNFKSQRLVKGL